MSLAATGPLLPTSIAYPLVIGCSIFGIIWGMVNIVLVSLSTHALAHRDS